MLGAAIYSFHTQLAVMIIGMIIAASSHSPPPIRMTVLRIGRKEGLIVILYQTVASFIRGNFKEKEGAMTNTLLKFIIAKGLCDDPAADRFRPWIFPSIIGSFEKETNQIFETEVADA